MLRSLVLALATASVVLAKAQLALLPADDWQPRITKGGVAQTLLQLGGLNNPQMSEVDVDGDGQLDLYFFDRAGDVHVAVGYAGRVASDFVDKSSFVRDWPAAQNFVLLRDFDADGVADMFTSGSETGREGILVYKGFRQNGRLQFSPVALPGRLGDILGYRTDNGDQLIYVARTDIPAIQDIDGDGDLDILSFDSNGSFIYLYRNTATRTGTQPTDYLRFELETRCYGGVYEDNQNAQLLLATSAGGCGFNPFTGPVDTGTVARPTGGIHPGSTLALHDLDGDGDLDLLIGDVSSTFVTALYNTPSGKTDYFSSQTMNWPSGTGITPIDLSFFPGVYFFEDEPCPAPCTRPDFLVTPSNTGGGEDYNCMWLYDEVSSVAAPVLRQRDFLTELAFDHGTGTHFAMGQLDGSGLQDLLVGVDYLYTPSIPGGRRASLRYYQCSDGVDCSEQNPAWLQAINDLLSPAVIGLDPALADLDGDGDLDLLIGNSDGGITYARNVSSGSTVRFEIADQTLLSVSGTYASPAVSDVNGDGLPDLIVGVRRGTLSLYLNRGTRTQPRFSAAADDELYGRVDVRTAGVNGSAFSRPAVATVAGRAVLYVGSAQGRMVAYTNLPPGPGGDATLDAELTVPSGTYLDPCVGFDVTRQLPVVLVGNRRGGLQAFRIEQTVGLRNATPALADIVLAPNPSSGTFDVANSTPDMLIDIYNALGQRVAHDRPGGERITVPLAPGVYEVVTKTRTQEPIGHGRLVVQ